MTAQFLLNELKKIKNKNIPIMVETEENNYYPLIYFSDDSDVFIGENQKEVSVKDFILTLFFLKDKKAHIYLSQGDYEFEMREIIISKDKVLLTSEYIPEEQIAS